MDYQSYCCLNSQLAQTETHACTPLHPHTLPYACAECLVTSKLGHTCKDNFNVYYSSACLVKAPQRNINIELETSNLFPPLSCLLCVSPLPIYCLEFHTTLFFNRWDKTCNISTISKMNAQRIKSQEEEEGWE